MSFYLLIASLPVAAHELICHYVIHVLDTVHPGLIVVRRQPTGKPHRTEHMVWMRGVEKVLGLHVVWREEQWAFELTVHALQDVMVCIHERGDRFVSLKGAVDSLQGFF